MLFKRAIQIIPHHAKFIKKKFKTFTRQLIKSTVRNIRTTGKMISPQYVLLKVSLNAKDI